MAGEYSSMEAVVATLLGAVVAKPEVISSVAVAAEISPPLTLVQLSLAGMAVVVADASLTYCECESGHLNAYTTSLLLRPGSVLARVLIPTSYLLAVLGRVAVPVAKLASTGSGSDNTSPIVLEYLASLSLHLDTYSHTYFGIFARRAALRS